MVPPGENVIPGSGVADYHNALNAGRTGSNCTHLYNSCPIDGIKIMNAVVAFLPWIKCSLNL